MFTFNSALFSFFHLTNKHSEKWSQYIYLIKLKIIKKCNNNIKTLIIIVKMLKYVYIEVHRNNNSN